VPVWLNYETIRQVEVPANYFNEREVPRNIYRDRLVNVRAVIESIKEVPRNFNQRAEIIAHTNVVEVHTNTETVKLVPTYQPK